MKTIKTFQDLVVFLKEEKTDQEKEAEKKNLETTKAKEKQSQEKEQLKNKQDAEMAKAREQDFKNKEKERQKDAEDKARERKEKEESKKAGIKEAYTYNNFILWRDIPSSDKPLNVKKMFDSVYGSKDKILLYTKDADGNYDFVVRQHPGDDAIIDAQIKAGSKIVVKEMS